MGKSQATFSKKEKEKLRLKKRQDKEQKKEDRKASSNKGKSIDHMIAYVDENGNFSTTPPDPEKKKQVNQENIQIGIAKQADRDPADLLRQGIVSFYNSQKGYGFIQDKETNVKVFFHMNGLIDAVKENNKVTFETEKTPKGPSAINIRVIG